MTAGQSRGSKGLLALLMILAIGVFLIAGLSACGGDPATSTDATEQADDSSAESSVAGSYKVETTTEDGMDAFTLTLKDDGTFSLMQPDPETGEEVGIGGTYTVADDKITMTNDEGSESDAGTVDGDKLVFETITWARQ
jgi:hypothetical protein